jgi:hypothetical protein
MVGSLSVGLSVSDFTGIVFKQQVSADYGRARRVANGSRQTALDTST